MPDAHRDEIAKLESLYSEHPEGRIFTHLAEAYRKAGEYDRAREVLDQGIQIHPDYASAHVVLGRVLMDQGEAREAEEAFSRVLKLDAHNLVALRSMGDLARSDGRREQAEDYYARLLEVEPADRDVLEVLEDMRSSGPPAEAEPEPELEPEAPTDPGYDQDLELDPIDSMDGIGDAVAAADQGMGGDEPELGTEGSTPSTTPGVMTETIAQVYARQGLYDRAAEVYRELVRERPNDPGLRGRLEEMEALAAESEEALPGALGLESPLTGGGEDVAEPTEPSEPAEPTSWDVSDPLGGFEELEGTAADTPDTGDSADVAPEAMEGLEPMELEGPEVAPEPMEGLEVNELDPDTGLAAEVTPSEDLPDASEEMDVRDVPGPPEEEPWAADLPDEEPWAADLPEPETEPGREPEPELGSESEPEPEPERDSVWASGDWDEPDAETPYAWGETEPEEDVSPPIQSYIRTLLGWSGGEGAAPAESGASAEAEVDTGPEPAPERPTERPTEQGEEDDDLEMFQSWLESLKQ